MGCYQGENVVGGPRGRRALILSINCTVIERDAGGCRASLKLMVQLEAAEEAGYQDSSPRGCSRRICGPANKERVSGMGWYRVPASVLLRVCLGKDGPIPTQREGWHQVLQVQLPCLFSSDSRGQVRKGGYGSFAAGGGCGRVALGHTEEAAELTRICSQHPGSASRGRDEGFSRWCFWEASSHPQEVHSVSTAC